MPDRRQNDRRESGITKKSVSISLQTFITIVSIVSVILVSIVVCKILINKAYNEAYNIGFEEGYNEGYDSCFADIYDESSANEADTTDIIDEEESELSTDTTEE